MFENLFGKKQEEKVMENPSQKSEALAQTLQKELGAEEITLTPEEEAEEERRKEFAKKTKEDSNWYKHNKAA